MANALRQEREDNAQDVVPLHRFEARPKVITLCGSSRFFDVFQKMNAELTLQGNVVFSIAVPSTSKNGELPKAAKGVLDSVHLHKIRMSDGILVLNVDGYIGESTRREIEFAQRIGRTVEYLEPAAPSQGPLFEK